MKAVRAVFVLSLVIAAIVGLGLGWWLRGATDESVESRAHRAAQHMREAFRSLTR